MEKNSKKLKIPAIFEKTNLDSAKSTKSTSSTAVRRGSLLENKFIANDLLKKPRLSLGNIVKNKLKNESINENVQNHVDKIKEDHLTNGLNNEKVIETKTNQSNDFNKTNHLAKLSNEKVDLINENSSKNNGLETIEEIKDTSFIIENKDHNKLNGSVIKLEIKENLINTQTSYQNQKNKGKKNLNNENKEQNKTNIIKIKEEKCNLEISENKNSLIKIKEENNVIKMNEVKNNSINQNHFKETKVQQKMDDDLMETCEEKVNLVSRNLAEINSKNISETIKEEIKNSEYKEIMTYSIKIEDKISNEMINDKKLHEILENSKESFQENSFKKKAEENIFELSEKSFSKVPNGFKTLNEAINFCDKISDKNIPNNELISVEQTNHLENKKEKEVKTDKSIINNSVSKKETIKKPIVKKLSKQNSENEKLVNKINNVSKKDLKEKNDISNLVEGNNICHETHQINGNKSITNEKLDNRLPILTNKIGNLELKNDVSKNILLNQDDKILDNDQLKNSQLKNLNILSKFEELCEKSVKNEILPKNDKLDILTKNLILSENQIKTSAVNCINNSSLKDDTKMLDVSENVANQTNSKEILENSINQNTHVVKECSNILKQETNVQTVSNENNLEQYVDNSKIEDLKNENLQNTKLNEITSFKEINMKIENLISNIKNNLDEISETNNKPEIKINNNNKFDKIKSKTKNPNENLRKSNENLRKSNENIRKSNENLRKSNENLRKSNDIFHKSKIDLRNSRENLTKVKDVLIRRTIDENRKSAGRYLSSKSKQDLVNGHFSRQTSVDSNYGSLSTIQTIIKTPSSSSLASSNYESTLSTSSQISQYDTAKSQIITNKLPPMAPKVVRRSVSYTGGGERSNKNIKQLEKSLPKQLQQLPKSVQKLAAHLQSRPLKNDQRRNSEQNIYPKNILIQKARSLSPSNFKSQNSRLTSTKSMRSPSPTPSTISSYSTSTNTSGPRRIYPQKPVHVNLDELKNKHNAPVVFDANLSFILGCKSQIRPKINVTPSHLDKTSSSNYLSQKINNFLTKTDHVMEEWKNIKGDMSSKSLVIDNEDDDEILGDISQSKSAKNIAIKAQALYGQIENNLSRRSVGRSIARSRSNSTIREFLSQDLFDDSFQDCFHDEVSEITADLAEEHSTATLATERLEAEQAERCRLERELNDVHDINKNLSQQSERLEMELLYARADLNGVSSIDENEDVEGEGVSTVYKQKYERACKELEFIKRRLQQQHEDDLEQLVGLKKQLEKKLADAYEEVEEQRQIVAQWKRKVQKLTSEMNDLRLLLEDQTARNNQLEKKQRKFDSETQLLQDELKAEKQNKDRLCREKDILLTEKFALESNLADVRLDLELKEERLNLLQQEYNDLTFGGKSEDEVTALRKQKQDLERRLTDQEEELDDLAGQVQMLEQAKVRLEMSLEQQRKESRKEQQQRDDELEEVRGNAQKKVKALEAQLENEHEERTILLREKHSLERRLAELSEQGRNIRATDEAQLQRLKKDLKRTKALLRDANTQIEKSNSDSTNKLVLRQLRNQLEDVEFARASAVKGKQALETELAEVQAQLEELQRLKTEADNRAQAAIRERSELRMQLEENEEELAEVMKKYRSTIQQLSVDQKTLQEQYSLIADLEAERNSLKEQIAELQIKLESIESLGGPTSSAQAKKLELRIKELESKLEFEQTTRARLEVQIQRLKEQTEKLQDELIAVRNKEQQAQDQIRKLQKNLRESRDENALLITKESESLQKRKELEKRIESCEAESAAAKADLRLALQRIEDLQAAIQGELDDDESSSNLRSDENDTDSSGSDESIETFLANHNLGSSTKYNDTSSRISTRTTSMSSVFTNYTTTSSKLNLDTNTTSPRLSCEREPTSISNNRPSPSREESYA